VLRIAVQAQERALHKGLRRIAQIEGSDAGAMDDRRKGPQPHVPHLDRGGRGDFTHAVQREVLPLPEAHDHHAVPGDPVEGREDGDLLEPPRDVPRGDHRRDLVPDRGVHGPRGPAGVGHALEQVHDDDLILPASDVADLDLNPHATDLQREENPWASLSFARAP